MNTSSKTTLAVAVATIAVGLVTSLGASAQSDLQKINKKVTHAVDKAGHATAYSVHKDSKAVGYSTRKVNDHASIATHKAMGKNSVVRDRAKKKNYIIHADGSKSPEPKGSTAKR